MKSLGILGGGQLARMLALKAPELGLKLSVLSPSKEDSAVQVTGSWHKGDPYKVSDITEFLKSVDILTFESEFIPALQIEEALQKLKDSKKIHIAPSTLVLNCLQDRLTQKEWLTRYHFNTAEFVRVDVKEDSVQESLLQVWSQLGPFVLKSRTRGYDGYGTFVFKAKRDIERIQVPEGLFIAEKWIPFERELAVLAARNAREQIVFFPLVESFQEDSKCLWVKGPVSHSGLDLLKKQIIKFLHGISYEGLMAFELFDTGDDLMINELAPRVHNSGHYSLDALSEDQFTAHLRAVFNLNLQSPQLLKKGFAMLNLLGAGVEKPSFQASEDFYCDLNEHLKNLSIKSSLKIKKNVFLWWYGKTVRLGRKMGHLNAIASSPDKALQELFEARKLFEV